MARPSAVRLLHSHIWQRLPRTLRRSALFHATALAAPKASPGIKAAFPIIVVGALRTASGLGQSARLCHDALKAAGLPVYGIDVTSLLMQVEDFPDFAFRDGRQITGRGTLIVHANSPTLPLVMSRLGTNVVAGRWIVGCWTWELKNVPEDWKHGIPFVHEIWVPSAFTADAILPIARDRPVRIVPYAVALQHPPKPPRVRPGGRPFTVLTLFNASSSFARKNPCAAIGAFRAAFNDDPGARLIVKASNAANFADGLRLIAQAACGAQNITILDKTLSPADLACLYDEADALISLHRSEGFGLTLAEAMLRGVPVVATDWSGNLDFLNEETGVPVPFRLIPAQDPQGSYHHPSMTWADADIDIAAAALRRLRDDPVFSKRLTQKASISAQESWSGERYASSVCRHLDL